MGVKQGFALFIFTTVGMFFGGVTRQALAYLPPSDFIIRTLAKKHKGFHRIAVVSTVTGMDKGQPDALHFRAHTVYLPSTGFLKSWATDDQGIPLYEVQARAPHLPLLVSLLFEANGGQVESHLKDGGIPIVTETDLSAIPTDQARQGFEKTMLSRWNSTLAWVIGADGPKTRGTTPELWIEKDTFLPLRLLADLQPNQTPQPATPTIANPSSTLDDIHLDNYGYFREFPYPRQITFFRAGNSQPEYRDDVNDVQVDNGFDASRLRINENGFTESGNSVPGPLHEMIQSYYTAIR